MPLRTAVVKCNVVILLFAAPGEDGILKCIDDDFCWTRQNEKDPLMRMKSWVLTLTVTLGLAAAAVALLWSPFDRPPRDRSETRGTAGSVGVPAASPGVQLVGRAGSQPATREATPQKAPAVPISGGLDPLFAAMSIHRPVDKPEAPEFTLSDLSGRSVHLRELRGKLVFVNFWATWCAPCRLEMPSMERLYQTFKETEFAMLAVSIDRQGADVVKPFIQDLQLTFPVLLDRGMEVTRAFGMRGLPTTYLIDRDGRLIGAAVGSRAWYSIEAKALIAGLLLDGTSSPTNAAQQDQIDEC